MNSATLNTEINVTFDRERNSATDCRWWVDVNGEFRLGARIEAVYEYYPEALRGGRHFLVGYEVVIERLETLVFLVTDEISHREALKNAKAYMTMVLTATEETATEETTETEINVAIETIAELTHWNDHSQAVVVLAETFGTDQQITEARRIKELHRERGCMSRELLTRRDLVSTKIMLSIAKRDLDLYYRVEKAF